MKFFDHFDVLAPIYDIFIKERKDFDIQEYLSLPIPLKVLDSGGGTGRSSKYLSKHNIHIVVADLSFPMLSKAKNNHEITALCTLAEALPFEKNTFDQVMMVDALHHVYNQRKVIEELYRVLTSGGYLLIEEPNIEHWGVKLVALAEKIFLMRSKFLKPKVIASLLNGLGMDIRVVVENHTVWVVAQKNNVN